MAQCRGWMALLALLLFVRAAHGGDLEDGMAAYRAKDYAQAFLLLQPLAEQEVAEAQFVLGQMYRLGQGMVPSLPEAIPLLQRAAQSGHPGALNAMAEMYETGEGLTQSFTTAQAYFEQAAAAGSVQAQRNLGLHYIRFEDHRDFTKALDWLERAAQQDDAESQYLLGRFLLDGKGRPEDDEQGIKWLLRAAEQGHVWAQRFLYVFHIEDVPTRAIELRNLKRYRAAGTFRLTASATDPEYGFSASKPIKTGPGLEAEWRYLNALRGPQGQVVHFRSLGQCCFFKVDGRLGVDKGFLDRYELTYEGLAKPVILHLTMFETSDIAAPVGFSFENETNP